MSLILMGNIASYSHLLMAGAATNPIGPALLTLVGLEAPLQAQVMEHVAVQIETRGTDPDLVTQIRAAIPEVLSDDFERPDSKLIAKLREQETVIQEVLDSLIAATERDPQDNRLRLAPHAPQIRAAFFGALDEGHFLRHFDIPDNPLEWLFRLELASKFVSPDEVLRAREIAVDILKDVEARLDEDEEMSPQEQLQLVYQILGEKDLLGSRGEDTVLFTKNLNAGSLDCDDSCLMVLAIAHQYDWPVSLVWLRDHAILRYDDGELQFNIDMGRIRPDADYQENEPRPLVGLDSEGLQALFYFNIGFTLLNQGRYEEAIAYFREALLLRPNESMILANRGKAELILDNLPEAIIMYEKAIIQDPQDPETHYGLGLSLIEAQRYDSAHTVFSNAIKLFPNYARLHHGYGRLLYEEKDYEEAKASFIAFFKKRASSDQDVEAEASYFLGLCYFHLDQYMEALDFLEEAVRLDDKDAEALFYLGLTQYHIGDHEEAIASIRRALAMDPEYIDPLIPNEIRKLLASS